MKYLILVLTAFFSITAFAQGDDIPVKTDGTKYYLQIYDGNTNEKVLAYKVAAGWQYRIFTDDYFDGSQRQLWSFEATEMFPGYFSIVNHEPGETFHLMSYNWFAYFSDADNRDPKSDKEMQFKFVKVTDEYYKLITIEKPTDGSLYNINYTPGADALNVDANGQADFGDVKSDDITPENMINMVFKLVEFNPMELFEESIVRGDNLYNDNPNAPEELRFDLFYVLEKAREVRVFGTEAEMLAFQPQLDSIMGIFNQALNMSSIIADAREFIDSTEVDSDVKNSFNSIVDEAEVFLNAEDIEISKIDSVLNVINDGKSVVNTILEASTYAETLSELDARFLTGVNISIDTAKVMLQSNIKETGSATFAASHFTATQTLIEQIIAANDLIASVAEFEEAKAELTAAIEQAFTVLTSKGNDVATLEQAVSDLKDAVKAFQRALEAGDTPVNLQNADLEIVSTERNTIDSWIVEATADAVYFEQKGVGGSYSITSYRGAEYNMKAYQSLGELPNGLYSISFYANVRTANDFEFFAESGSSNTTLLIEKDDAGLVQRSLEVEVTDGNLDFGFRGAGTDNAVPAGSWIVFDEIEMKWKSNLPIENADFENVGSGYNNIPGWDAVASGNVSYFEGKGVDGSQSITCYSGAEYSIEISQTITGLPNGTYNVSAMTKANTEAAFVVFGESNGISSTATVPQGPGELVKTKTTVEVNDGSLKFGVRGAAEGNVVPGTNWIVFDNVELVRLPNMPVENADFENVGSGYNNIPGWDVVASGNVSYFEAKGVDGSQSITCYSGSEYSIEISQTITGVANGEYAVSAMTKSNIDAGFVVFGESDAVSMTATTPIGGGTFVKTEAMAEVSNGELKFGVSGAGSGNTVPSGWIVFDNVELMMKSIIPTYQTPPPIAEKSVALEIENDELKNEIVYWQDSYLLNIRSSNTIVKYSVYSITGALVDSRDSYSNMLSISIDHGIYIVKVLTENGNIDTKKIVVK